MGTLDFEFIDKLTKHALGLEADADDDLLRDVQQWLTAKGILQRVAGTVPCGSECACSRQLERVGGTAICFRLPNLVPAGRIKGRVKFYRERLEYGFVVADGEDRDIFLHKKYIGNMTPEQLVDGSAVTFTVQTCKKGLQVTSILPADGPTPGEG